MMHDGDGNDGVKSGVAERQRKRFGAQGVETAFGGDGGEVERTVAPDFEEGVGGLECKANDIMITMK